MWVKSIAVRESLGIFVPLTGKVVAVKCKAFMTAFCRKNDGLEPPNPRDPVEKLMLKYNPLDLLLDTSSVWGVLSWVVDLWAIRSVVCLLSQGARLRSHISSL
jgi:hypothetical protein